jgi:hypothetical protein
MITHIKLRQSYNSDSGVASNEPVDWIVQIDDFEQVALDEVKATATSYSGVNDFSLRQ